MEILGVETVNTREEENNCISFYVSDRSMEPEYKRGSKLLGTRIGLEEIPLCRTYIIDSEMGIILRNITEINNKGIKCEALSQAGIYQSSVIPYGKIKGIYDIKYKVAYAEGAGELTPLDRDGFFMYPVTDESMAPKYERGSWLIVEELKNTENLYPGNVYVFDLGGTLILRYMAKAEDESRIRLRVYNDFERWGEMEIPKRLVTNVYKIGVCYNLS